MDSKALGSRIMTVAAGVVAAWAVVGLVRAYAGDIFPPTVPEGYQVARTDHYILYAPSAAALREGEEELRRAGGAFQHYFGVAPPRIAIVLADHPDDFHAIDLEAFRRSRTRFLPFLTRRYFESAGLASGTGATTTELDHEACHVYMEAYADQLSSWWNRSESGYGHGALPDWVDEMGATLCEGPGPKQQRRAFLRGSFGDRISLGTFTAMPHPLSGADRSAIDGDGAAGPAVVRIRSGDEVNAFLAWTKSELFYAQALSLGEFLYERGGSDALSALTSHLVSGRSMDEALRRTSRVVPRVPSDLSALEADWLRWVEGREGT